MRQIYTLFVALFLAALLPVASQAAGAGVNPTSSRADGDWVELTLETVGPLGVEILYQPGIDACNGYIRQFVLETYTYTNLE
ncbi:MAG: hypothetical protein NC342_02895 [Pseudoflavonifractor sp.]|nr:hypothetical protein [Alloprevotella sp.]MCM1116460.1 hypothetical protein [Pseudoflavonifractor sp.]